MKRWLASCVAIGLVAGCQSAPEREPDVHYGAPQFPNGFSAGTGGYSPAPFGSFDPKGQMNAGSPELGQFHGAAIPNGWKGFTGN
jgi:hypothetical protein